MDIKQSDAEVVNAFLAIYKPDRSMETSIASAMLEGCLAAFLLGTIQQYFDWPLSMLGGVLLAALTAALIPARVMWLAFRIDR